MKIFVEYRGSKRQPWICFLAESSLEKRELEKLHHDAQPDNDWAYTDTYIEWQQQGFKLMLMLQEDVGT